MEEKPFLAQSLKSNELLALLFICENERKKTSVHAENFLGHERSTWPQDWESLLETFHPRLGNSTEQIRFEILEAHLMSAEDLDIYSDDVLRELLEKHGPWIKTLAQDLEQDIRFRIGHA